MTRPANPWEALADAWLALIAHRANVARIMARRHRPVVLQEIRK